MDKSQNDILMNMLSDAYGYEVSELEKIEYGKLYLLLLGVVDGYTSKLLRSITDMIKMGFIYALTLEAALIFFSSRIINFFSCSYFNRRYKIYFLDKKWLFKRLCRNII